MSDEQPKQDNPRLEKLLRRWGVDEASRQTRVGDLPITRGQPTPTPAAPARPAPAGTSSTRWRWLALAASLALVVGVAAVFFTNSGMFTSDAPHPPSDVASVKRNGSGKPVAVRPAPHVTPPTLPELTAPEPNAEMEAIKAQLKGMQAQLSAATAKRDEFAAELGNVKGALKKTELEFASREAVLKAASSLLKTDATRLRADLERFKTDAARLAVEGARLKAEVAQLKATPKVNRDELVKARRDLQTAKDSLIALSKRFEAKERAAEDAGKTLAKRDEELKQARMKLARLTTRDDKEQVKLRTLLASLQKELTALQADQARTRADLARAQDALAVANAKRTGNGGMLQTLYLAAAAPGQTGWHARKTAASGNRLLQRQAQLVKSLRSPETRKLFGTLDVALTQLDMLDATNARAVNSFKEMLSRANVANRLAAVLQAGAEREDVRQWLLEAQLVLLETPK
jgi:hypothetical protein